MGREVAPELFQRKKSQLLERLVEDRKPHVLRLHILLGLEARHIVCRWREPPEYQKYSAAGLKGRHNRQCTGLSGLRFLILVYRWLTPPALDTSALRA